MLEDLLAVRRRVTYLHGPASEYLYSSLRWGMYAFYFCFELKPYIDVVALFIESV
jgi:hypothetical protein